MTDPTADNTENEAVEKISDPASRVIDLTKQLTSVIHEEIRLLEDRRPRDIEPLQAEKIRLGQLYAKEYKTLRRNPALLGGPDSPARLKLRQLTIVFHEELLTLGRVLTRLRTVTEGMVQAVGEEVEKQRPRVGNYSPTAKVIPPAARQPMPLTFHQVI